MAASRLRHDGMFMRRPIRATRTDAGERDEKDSMMGHRQAQRRNAAMDLKLKGRKAIVTGSSKGIGRAIAEALADEGCHVAICARDEGEVKAAVGALKKKGVNATGASFDVRDKDALDAWVKKSGEALGGIDIAVANVSALDMERGENAWKNEFEIDMMHTVRTVEAALPWIEKSDAGAILVISSVSGLEFDFTSPAYGTFKAALDPLRLAHGEHAGGQAYPRQHGVTRQHLFRGRRVAEDRAEHARPLQGRARQEPLGPHGDGRGSGERGRVPGQPARQLHHRRERRGRRGADEPGAVLTIAPGE